MEPTEYTLIIVNLVAGFGCAVPVAKLLSKLSRNPRSVFRYFAILICIYFIECIAVVIGMGIPVFSMGLAFVWGIIFGLRFRARASRRKVLKTSFFLSLYTTLPAVSFIVVPVVAWIGGWHILNANEGAPFGIPEFLNLPWPLNTILGFFAALVVGAIVFKTVITMAEVSLLIYLVKHHAVDKVGSDTI
jgi:hypothetical protein